MMKDQRKTRDENDELAKLRGELEGSITLAIKIQSYQIKRKLLYVKRDV